MPTADVPEGVFDPLNGVVGSEIRGSGRVVADSETSPAPGGFSLDVGGHLDV